MAKAKNRVALMALMLMVAGAAAACNISFSQIDFSRIETSGAPSATPRFAGGGVYPPVGPGR